MSQNQFSHLTWFAIQEDRIDELNTFLKNDPSYDSNWLTAFCTNSTNEVIADLASFEKNVIKGSLVYKQRLREVDFEVFHFYLTNDYFVTVNFDTAFLKVASIDYLHKLLEQSPNAIAGFLILLGEILNQYLSGIDNFEIRHRELMWKIHQINQTSTLEDIYTCRHELMIWKNLLIPLNDLSLAINEVYLEEIDCSDAFKRTCKRIERALFLTNEYQKQLETMINMENVISSHRGNEIMKTLTVITILFTPIMAWGALWGMNFRHMPELNWKYGYFVCIGLILVSTISLYWYLRIKGWTGDILKGKKKGSFFK